MPLTLRELLSMKSFDEFTSEFLSIERENQELQAITLAGAAPFKVASSMPAALKNAFLDIKPYDHNLVRLPENRYINASFVTDHQGKPAFIAAQGPRWDADPKKSSAADFLHMVWEHKVGHTLMLCQEHEVIASPECGPYWGPVNKKTNFSPFTIYHSSDDITLHSSGLVERKITITLGEETRVLRHWHYNHWLDFDTPSSVESFLNVYKIIMSEYKSHEESGPLVVHCRAGIGRTGTFICVSDLYEKINKELKEGKRESEIVVNVLDTVKRLRRDRAFMVQQPGQYCFIYKALAKLFSERDN